MRIFTRYILREISAYAFLGGVLFTFILFMRYLLPLLELFVRGIASAVDIAKIVCYLLPGFVTLTLPMAVLVGTLLGLSRLAADSEITAMRASGLGILGFLRIVGVLAGFCWLLGMANSIYAAPWGARKLLEYEARSRNSQVTVQVQPRVFYEDMKNYVLYVQDVTPGANGAALWTNVFLADLSKPDATQILTSKQAVVQGGGPSTLQMVLSDGSRHDYKDSKPDEYDITPFDTTSEPVQTGQTEDEHVSRRDTPQQALSLPDLREQIRTAKSRADRSSLSVELQRRFAYPAACIVLMLVGVPLGLASKRGGKGAGFVLTLALVLVYYVLSLIGMTLAKEGKLPAFLGTWAANILFTAVGVLLIQQMSTGGAVLSAIAGFGSTLSRPFMRKRSEKAGSQDYEDRAPHEFVYPMQWLRRALHIRFPLILDEYVLGSFLRNFALVVTGVSLLFLVFTFFELIGDIVRNRTLFSTVGDYLLNLIPFVLYNLTPLCALVAALITFGTLSRTSEITAMKATGVSLYRIVAPILVLAGVLAALLFVFDQTVLPAANRRQEALLNEIRGKPAQTFLQPGRKWMSGHTSNSGEPLRIFYYQFFDADKDPSKNVFGNLTVFEFQPGTFTLTRRIYAKSAYWDDRHSCWVLEDGWQRSFQGGTVSNYSAFTLSSFPEIRETPAYFKKDDRPYQEMSYTELDAYINDLSQSGFDTVRLRVQLQRKLAYPLVSLVMALLAVPFALQTGKRGSIAGMGAAIGLVIAYYVVSGVSENLGNVNTLPAMMAAWSPDLLFALAGGYMLLRTPT